MEKIGKYLEQIGNFLITRKKCILYLDLNDYSIGDNLIFDEEANYIWLKSLISKIEFDEISFDLILDYPVNIFVEKYEIEAKKQIKLFFSEDRNMLETVLESEDIKKQTLYLERLLGGKELFKDVDHFFLKIFNLFSTISDMDSVHLEVLISNVLRDKRDFSIPARLGKTFDPKLINIKDIVFQQNTFLSSLNFENINKAIATSLISDDVGKDKTILEKTLINEIIPVEADEKE